MTLRSRLKELEKGRQAKAQSPIVIYHPQRGETVEDAQARAPKGTRAVVYIPDNGRSRR